MADPASIRLPGSGVFEIENLPTACDFLRERGLAYVRNRRRGKKWRRGWELNPHDTVLQTAPLAIRAPRLGLTW